MTKDEFKSHLQEKNPSVLAFSKRKKLQKLFRVIAINVGVILLTFFTVNEMAKPQLVLPTYLVGAVLCVWFTLAAKPRGLLRSKIYVGIIEKAEIKEHMAAREDHPYSMRMRTFYVLTIIDENENMKVVEIPPKYASCYSAGDRVAMVPAIAYPFLIDPPEDRQTVCWWCGSIKRAGHNECMNCNRIYYD